MIRTFRLRDFKGHRDTQLALGRFTMLVGDNASGKTSVLDALALQAGLAPNPVSYLRQPYAPEDLLRRGSNGSIVLSSEGVRSELSWTTALTLKVLPKRAPADDARWEVDLQGSLGGIRFAATSSGTGGGGTTPGEGWDKAAEAFGTSGAYHLQAERIAAAAASDVPNPPIGVDGSNVAVALAAMKLGDDEAFQRVEDAMRQLIPSIERVRIRPATVHPSWAQHGVIGSKLYFDFRGAPGVPADGASHGTLIVLALLAILHGSNRPDLILLDDFDHALHPRAQMALVRMLQNLLKLDELKGVQIVATTHSPYMLDEVETSAVYGFALRDDGTVASKRLSEHPEAEKTRGTLSAGQLWSLDPERDWVLRG
ncbi:MAG TPA: AAA family ATPase [Kofleriaceae bacterium]|jgi:predicted ATPase|nr:AAA family ATPase [Kofleriaceae bacterium]